MVHEHGTSHVGLQQPDKGGSWACSTALSFGPGLVQLFAPKDAITQRVTSHCLGEHRLRKLSKKYLLPHQ